MDRNKVREDIATILFDWINDGGWEWGEVDEDVRDHYRNKTDSILSLPALREALEKATGTCEWTVYPGKYGYIQAGCGNKMPLTYRHFKHCPDCGKRTSIKVVKNGN